jgi:hypothetical protein
MTRGGVVPGGIDRRTVCATAVIWATAASTFTRGWKKVLTTEMPASVWDSMCSTSLTVVGNTRS